MFQEKRGGGGTDSESEIDLDFNPCEEEKGVPKKKSYIKRFMAQALWTATTVSAALEEGEEGEGEEGPGGRDPLLPIL